MAKIILFNVVFFILYFFIEWYAYKAVNVLIVKRNKPIKILFNVVYWGIVAAGFSLFIFRFVGLYTQIPANIRFWIAGWFISMFMFKTIIFLVFLLRDAIVFITWVFSKSKHKLFTKTDTKTLPLGQVMKRSDFLKYSTLAIGAIPLFSSLNGIFRNAYRYQVHKIKIPIKNLPLSFEGFTITHLSDIHSGSLNDKDAVLEGIKTANELKSDVIFFTGDLVNDREEEVIPLKEIFSKLHATHGVYSITGNHDYGDYSKWPNAEAKRANFKRFVQHHQDMGWRLLLNQHDIIQKGDDSIAIIGIENWGGSLRFPKYGKLKEAYKGCEHANVKLLLSHDPSHWDLEVRKDFKDIDATFSGHTHGFQMGVESKLFKFSPSQWVYKQWAGLYKEGNQHIYVNRGFGFIGYPGRIGILPEITQIELVRA